MAARKAHTYKVPPQNTEEKEEFSLKREIMEWVIVIEIAVALAFVLNMFIIVNAVIPTASMEPTIMRGDRVIGVRLSYVTKEPQRGDIVIFKYPDDEKQLFIKRIIGLPGDTVEIVDGDVYINGEYLEEPYLRVDAYGDYGPYYVPEGSYFMMGDNRNNSADSRFWNKTFVNRKKILGKAVFRYWPHPQKLTE